MPRARRPVLAVLAIALTACTGRPQVPILTFHSVGQADEVKFALTPQAFEAVLDAVGDFRTVSVRDAMTAPARRSVVLTFDDGTQDAVDVVLPALQKRGMRGSFFIVTGWVGKPGYLDWDGIRKLRKAGMEIGSHTVTHPRLPSVSDQVLRSELRESRQALEQELNEPCETFAYPFAAAGAREERAVREAGYRWALAGMVHGSRDPLSLYRLTVKGGTRPNDLRSALE